MTQVTQLIIRPAQDQTRNLVLAIINVARKQPASQDTLAHIRTLAKEAIDLMSCSRSDNPVTTMSDKAELERQRFEAWFEAEYKHLESSKYTDAVPHIKFGFWMAWQAALSSKQEST